ncbi:MAG TPA: glucuronate isomerase [Clostridiaceae bacterium]|nr:glucuronate isomerase [Clostridiaceae bacterium]
MKKFLDEDFMLNSQSAAILYYQYAEKMPIIDFHNHLEPQEIYEDKQFSDISDLWLGGDHYKWRLMRAFGITEDQVTGNAAPYDKFLAFARMMPYTIGNPIFHWTHMELARYFGITDLLSEKTAARIYAECNEMLKSPEFSVRNLLLRMNVKVLCTTDDPTSDLKYHLAMRDEGFSIKVLPTFRPERAMAIEKPDFVDYISKLALSAGLTKIENITDLENALLSRIEFFAAAGCRISDHSLDAELFSEASSDKANQVLQKALRGEGLSSSERRSYKGYLLSFLGNAYFDHGFIMQLHIGAIRNNSRRMYELLGPDKGYDSMDDFNYAAQLSGLLNELDLANKVPYTIIYCLNGKENDMLATMIANFQGGGVKAKLQLGSAWWFLDNKRGMLNQMEAFANNGLISTFVGMVTDSRSFLSFPRHEYFRRILCDFLGGLIDQGEYPANYEFAGNIVQDICYNNINEMMFNKSLLSQ